MNDAVRSDYDQLARDHVLGLPDQQQKLLNIALGGGGEATLIQFASSCAARIMFEDLRYGRLLLDRTPPNGKLPSTKK